MLYLYLPLSSVYLNHVPQAMVVVVAAAATAVV
jgi:hypothetical protein